MTNRPKGHYSPIVECGDLLFTSGQLPIKYGDPTTIPSTIYDQTIMTLQKIEDLLVSKGLDRKAVVKTTAFITRLEDWPTVNEAYTAFFGDHKPARTVVPVTGLNFDCGVEIEAVAGK